MTDVNALEVDVENNPDDWELRLQLSQAYKKGMAALENVSPQ